MECYWLCLQETYKQRKTVDLTGLQVKFLLSDEIPSEKEPVVVECKELTKEVIEIASKFSEACIFIENASLNDSILQYIFVLSELCIPVFWTIEDVHHYLIQIKKILKSENKYLGLIDALDDYTKKHAFNVANLAAHIAIRLDKEFTPLDLELIQGAAFLHDIGKICMANSLLNAPRHFNKKEKIYISYHTKYGSQLIKKFNLGEEFNCLANDIISNHHERIDGTGYLTGKKGQQISLAARIVAVADVYDALRTTRPYKNAYNHEVAITYIKNSKKFDDKVVNILENEVLK